MNIKGNDFMNTKSSNTIIDVTIVIDTDTLINDFKKVKVSKNKDAPTGVSHKYAYMVVKDSLAIHGNGGADLNIKAHVGDVVRITGVSASDNFDSSVLVYHLKKYGGKEVFSNPHFKKYTRSSMMPKKDNIFPVGYEDQDYWFMLADITGKGTENYSICFAVYNRPQNGEQSLFGYFYWDPTITVVN